MQFRELIQFVFLNSLHNLVPILFSIDAAPSERSPLVVVPLVAPLSVVPPSPSPTAPSARSLLDPRLPCPTKQMLESPKEKKISHLNRTNDAHQPTLLFLPLDETAKLYEQKRGGIEFDLFLPEHTDECGSLSFERIRRTKEEGPRMLRNALWRCNFSLVVVKKLFRP